MVWLLVPYALHSLAHLTPTAVTRVFSSSVPQKSVVEALSTELLDATLSWNNSTVLGWGGPGTGKTRLFFGDAYDQGLVQRTIDGLLQGGMLQIGLSVVAVVGRRRIDLLDHQTRSLDANVPIVTVVRSSAETSDVIRTGLGRADSAAHIFCRVIVMDGSAGSGAVLTFCDLKGLSADSIATSLTRDELLSVERLLNALSISGTESHTAASVARECTLTEALHPLLTGNSRVSIVGSVSAVDRDEMTSKRILQLLSACTSFSNQCTRLVGVTWDQLCAVNSIRGTSSRAMDDNLRSLGAKSSYDPYKSSQDRYNTSINMSTTRAYSSLRDVPSSASRPTGYTRREFDIPLSTSRTYEPPRVQFAESAHLARDGNVSFTSKPFPRDSYRTVTSTATSYAPQPVPSSTEPAFAEELRSLRREIDAQKEVIKFWQSKSVCYVIVVNAFSYQVSIE